MQRILYRPMTDPEFREEVLLDIQQIFEIEKKCKTESPEERVRVRELEASPIIDFFQNSNFNLDFV